MSEDELAERSRKVWDAPTGYKASEIAKELLPRRYPRNPDAARKYVAEAIALVKPTPEAFIEKHLADEKFLLDMIMGAKPPFD